MKTISLVAFLALSGVMGAEQLKGNRLSQTEATFVANGDTETADSINKSISTIATWIGLGVANAWTGDMSDIYEASKFLLGA
jgi:hypothetical protein